MFLQKGEMMLLESLKAIYLREINTLEREVDLYPDDANIWRELPGLPNSAGNLILHLAGNLQHFFGATLGNTGYVRDREAEFSKRNTTRHALKKELEATRPSLEAAFSNLTEDKLEETFPVKVGDSELSTQEAMLHFLSHLAYHLGQIDYHRRAVTGDSTPAKFGSTSELAKK
jgi:uncharacterized damage-inducible protein DinB